MQGSALSANILSVSFAVFLHFSRILNLSYFAIKLLVSFVLSAC